MHKLINVGLRGWVKRATLDCSDDLFDFGVELLTRCGVLAFGQLGFGVGIQQHVELLRQIFREDRRSEDEAANWGPFGQINRDQPEPNDIVVEAGLTDYFGLRK